MKRDLDTDNPRKLELAALQQRVEALAQQISDVQDELFDGIGNGMDHQEWTRLTDKFNALNKSYCDAETRMLMIKTDAELTPAERLARRIEKKQQRNATY